MSIQEKIVRYSGQHALSDLHFHAGQPMVIRLNGEIKS